MENRLTLRKIGMAERDIIKDLFRSVFTAETGNDNRSDERQPDDYLSDLIGQSSSLAFGLCDGGELIALSMGRIKHWYTGRNMLSMNCV